MTVFEILFLPVRGEIVSFGEAGVVEVGEAGVVDRFAHLDGKQVAVGVEDDFTRPYAVDGVGGNASGGEDFGFVMATAVCVAVGGGVVEGGVDVDAVRVVELVHVADLPEGAVGQWREAAVCVELVVADDGAFRAFRQ
ncbi:hypothetical protein [Nocardia transvalensis]|uniref:hypothetical protein n=1 Tax=Nocardia transvalensis TaxID=37333 RepID=UPI001E4261EB|nr:hypothetical protein [Nocardia transvalensis]